MPTAICTECEAEFPSVRSTAAYCSSACRQRAYRNRKQPLPYRNTAPVPITPNEAKDEAVFIDWDSLPAKAKEKEARMRRVIRRELEAEFEPRVQAEIQRRLEGFVDRTEELQAAYQRVSNAHKGIFTRGDFDLIRSCLHPDSRLSVTDEKLATAFRMFNEANITLLNENDSPTTNLPPLEDLLKRRRGREGESHRAPGGEPGSSK